MSRTSDGEIRGDLRHNRESVPFEAVIRDTTRSDWSVNELSNSLVPVASCRQCLLGSLLSEKISPLLWHKFQYRAHERVKLYRVRGSGQGTPQRSTLRV